MVELSNKAKARGSKSLRLSVSVNGGMCVEHLSFSSPRTREKRAVKATRSEMLPSVLTDLTSILDTSSTPALFFSALVAMMNGCLDCKLYDDTMR